MRPTDAQHRAALAGHQGRVERWRAGTLAADEWRPIRLSYGLYYQLDHTSHMQRIKIPAGILTVAQCEAMADVAERWGRSIAHITTRQDIQIHWVPVEGIITMYERLLEAGITTRGACADSVRNVTGCPFAGTTADEAFDVTPYCLAVHEYFLFNPLNLTLPRKFKVAIEGCARDCAQAPINDIGAYAKRRGAQDGFAIMAAGGLGAQPFLAVPVADFVPADALLVWCEAIVRVQHRFGERKNRSRARMKYVAKRLGKDGLRNAIEAEVARVEAERGPALREELRETVAAYRVPAPAGGADASVPPLPGFDAWKRTNTHAQRQAGFRSVVVRVPLGDVTSEQLRGVARLIGEYGNGTLRTTNDQNLVLPWIAEATLPAVHARLAALELGEADAQTIVDVVSCPGMDYCSLAITRSMGMAERLRLHLESDAGTTNGFAARLGPFTVKISGCPNSCGQHHVGDIGLTGHNAKGADGVERPAYSILLGGSVGEGTARIGRRLGRFPEERAPAVIAALARLYERERTANEPFPVFVERVGTERLGAVATEAATVSAAPERA